MVKYEIGQRFPDEQYLNRGELAASIFNEYFFDVFVSLEDVTRDDIQTWEQGNLTLYLFEDKNIPFIVFKLFDEFNFKIDINIKKMNEDQVNSWLNSKENSVNMFFVDALYGSLMAQRTIVIRNDIAEKIRDICRKQADFDTTVVDLNISKVAEAVSMDNMIKNSTMKQVFV